MLRRAFTLLLALGFGSPWCCCFGAAAVAAESAPPMSCCGEPLEAEGETERGQPHDCPHAVQRDHQLADVLDLHVDRAERPLLAILSPIEASSAPCLKAGILPAELAQAPPDPVGERCARLAVFLL